MADELTIQTLIDKVKEDLFSPYRGAKLEGKSVYPLFLIDEVELDLSVSISYSAETGLKVTVLQTLEAEATGGIEKGQSHTIKVKLSPILSREELRELLDADTRLMAGIREASQAAIIKGTGDIAGSED